MRKPEDKTYSCNDLSCLHETIADFFRQSADDNILSAYIFGSAVYPGPFHDVDVAVFPGTPIDSLSFGSRLEQFLFAKNLKFPVDLRTMYKVPIWAKFEVIKTGRRIFERDFEEAVAMEAAIITEYLDFKYLLDLYNEHFFRRLKVGIQQYLSKTI